MSRIITKVKCKRCGTNIEDLYISFGHPEEDFVWKWECADCGEINKELIEKMPLTCVDKEVEDIR